MERALCFLPWLCLSLCLRQSTTRAEAPHWVARHPPGHLLVDFVLPDASGLRWLAAFRPAHSDLVAVLLAEDLHPAVLALAARAGACAALCTLLPQATPRARLQAFLAGDRTWTPAEQQ